MNYSCCQHRPPGSLVVRKHLFPDLVNAIHCVGPPVFAAEGRSAIPSVLDPEILGLQTEQA